MATSYRSAQALKQEIEYIKGYIPEMFGQELTEESFSAQIHRIIEGKIEDYIFQRYRDWTAPELANLLKRWNTAQEPALPEAAPKAASGQQQGSQGQPEALETKPKRGRPKGSKNADSLSV